MIMIFGTLVKIDDMFKGFFYFFKVLIFRVISGVKVQIIAQMTKNSAFRGLCLRDYASYDCHLWYKCIKWYLQGFCQKNPVRCDPYLKNVTIFCLPRSLEDILKTSWKRLGRRKIVTLKTSWRCLQDMSSRHVFKTCLQDILKTCLRNVHKTCLQDAFSEWECLLGISVSKKSKSVFDRSIPHISISDKSRQIQNALIRTQQL